MAWLKTKEPLRVHELMHQHDRTVWGSEVAEQRGCRCTAPAGRQCSRTSGPSWMTSPLAHISLSRCIYTRKSRFTHTQTHTQARTHCFSVGGWLHSHIEADDFTLSISIIFTTKSPFPPITGNAGVLRHKIRGTICWKLMKKNLQVDFTVHHNSKEKSWGRDVF